MNGFIKKRVDTLTLGEKLKKLRSERRMSLNEASKYTRIQIKYLEYLENGLYDKLPANVYVKGFLKNYAECLGVDENTLVRMYEKESEIKKNLEKRNFSAADLRKNNSFSGREKINISSFVLTPRIMAAVAIILALLGGFFYLYKEIGSFASRPLLVILSPENNFSTSENSIVVEGATDRDANIFLNGQPILANDDGKFSEKVTVQSGENVINIKAVNKFGKEAEESLTIKSTFKNQAIDTGEPANNANLDIADQGGLEMEIRVDPGPVWLSVEADGNLVFSGTMLSGATQSFQAENKIVINSGKGNATFLKFKGKDIGTLGDNAGAVRGKTYTSDMPQ